MSSHNVVPEIDQQIAALRSALERVAARVFSLCDESTVGAEHLDEMIAAIEPLCKQEINDQHTTIVGIGLIWEHQTGGPNSSGMLWWRTTGTEVARKTHVFNPDSDSYYDYRNSEWFTTAKRAGELAIVGPYIDAWGTDDHTITPSLPLFHNDAFIGVVAADLDVTRFTQQLSESLAKLGEAAIVDAEGRVVASTIPLVTSGLRIEPYLARTGRSIARRLPASSAGWAVITLDKS